MGAVILKPFDKTAFDAPAVAVAASVSSEAPNLGGVNFIVVTGFVVSLATVTANPPVQWALRDGAGGTIKMTGWLAAGANSGQSFGLDNLSIPMTPGNVAQLIFLNVPGADGRESVSLTYHADNATG